ncbi:MAG: 50S ribosomal protein L3 [Candidatus Omnitrophica bacterium]|nr:50S ribosomal protein L3 [Candidatus Omnitrophota bacterium]
MLGRKLGMTQIFDKEGNVFPVTVVEIGYCTVLELKEAPMKVKLGFDPIKEHRLTKPQLGFFKKIGVTPMRTVQEFSSTNTSIYKVGMELKADFFRPGDYVDVSGTSIGKGFQGGMKRHGWSGGPAAHGSMHHRRVGSVGACATPSKIVRGRPMPGQMGNERVTTQGLRVMDIDVEKNLLLIKGSVPGHANGTIVVQRSMKKAYKSFDEKKPVVKHKVNPMKQSKAKAGATKKSGGKKGK